MNRSHRRWSFFWSLWGIAKFQPRYSFIETATEHDSFVATLADEEQKRTARRAQLQQEEKRPGVFEVLRKDEKCPKRVLYHSGRGLIVQLSIAPAFKGRLVLKGY